MLFLVLFSTTELFKNAFLAWPCWTTGDYISLHFPIFLLITSCNNWNRRRKKERKTLQSQHLLLFRPLFLLAAAPVYNSRARWMSTLSNAKYQHNSRHFFSNYDQSGFGSLLSIVYAWGDQFKCVTIHHYMIFHGSLQTTTSAQEKDSLLFVFVYITRDSAFIRRF